MVLLHIQVIYNKYNNYYDIKNINKIYLKIG